MTSPTGDLTGPEQISWPLTVRDLEPTDLSDLDWSGGPEHVNAVAAALQASYAGETALLVVALPNGRLVGSGGLNLRHGPDRAELWMLSVHETLQSLGIGTRLVGALEARAVELGRSVAQIGVEHDNPRAAALYRRLGYVEYGSRVESWASGGRTTYVTVCTLLHKPLVGPPD